MSVVAAALPGVTAGAAPAPAGVPRLLAGLRAHRGRMSLAEHRRWYGPLPRGSRSTRGALTDAVHRAGLTGRGGAGFPTAVKLESVSGSRTRPVVVVNGMEGEPGSAKDRHLLANLPHLVLDGAAAAAGEVGAEAVMLAVRCDRVEAVESLSRAVAERCRDRIDRVQPEVHPGPPRYVGGEETALVHWLNGGPMRPTSQPERPFRHGVDGRPTLILNVETAAQLALIARYGGDWFRSVGLPAATGTALVTVGGAVAHGGVAEIVLGAPLRAVVEAHEPVLEPSMVLAGGYFGGWIPWRQAAGMTADPASLRAAGAGFGPGILIVAPAGACVIDETARIVAYLAREGAGQCGPCTHGVAAVARDLGELCTPYASGRTTDRLRRRIEMIDGRGACALPDGVRRLIASVLTGFATHVELHERGSACSGLTGVPLHLPAGPRSEDDWR